MALYQAEPMSQRKPDSLIGENHQFTLNESIQNLLAEIHDGTSNLSRFVDVFYHLMQAKIDPPLESIWVYAALSFHGHKSANEDPLNRVAVVKDLFQLISACSAPCSSLKSIALLAPVLFQVHTLVIELLAKDSGSKREKKAMKEVKTLVDVVLGCVSVCSSNSLNEENEESDLILNMPISDLARLWIDSNGGLESFFPLLSGETRIKLAEGDCDVNYLAGAVVLEAFFFKLLLDLRFGVTGAGKEKELRNLVVGSITGFRNVQFFEILVSMLLESTLPGSSLLNPKDEILRKVLYDAVLLVEYSFLDPNILAKLPNERMKNFAVSRLLLTHEAIEFCRENKDQKRAISYSNAFSTSRLRSQIMKWINIGIEGGANMINGSSPKTLLKLLFNLENEGTRVFEDSLLNHRAKLAINNSRGVLEQLASKTEEKKVDADPVFYVDSNSKAEEESEEEEDDDEDDDEREMMNAAFVNAAHSMKKNEIGGKKRKETGNVGKKSVKYFKYDLSDVSDLGKKNVASAASDDGSSSDCELEDPQSD